MKEHSKRWYLAKKWISNNVLGTLILLIGLIVVFPIIYCTCSSFMSPSEMSMYPPKFLPKSFGYLRNFKIVFTQTKILRFMLNSLILASAGTLLRLVTASLAGFAFSFYEFPGKKFLFFALLGTMMIPGDAVIISNYLTIARAGLLDTYLGMVIVYTVSAMYVFMVRQYMLTIPKAFHDAALMDGCSSWRFFLDIVLPVCEPVLKSVAIASFVGLWNAYLWPLLVTNIEEMRTVQVGITMLTNDEDMSSYGTVMAGVTVILIPAVILFFASQKNVIRGLTNGAIKE